MPKKTRNKKYKPITVRIGPYYSEEQRRQCEAQLNDVALYVECTLPTGNATNHEIDWIEDVLIWAIGLIHQRFEGLDQQELSDVLPVIVEGKHALDALIDRKYVKKAARFIATGDELRAISAAFAIIIPMLKEAMTLSPRRTMNEFDWAHRKAIQNLKKTEREMQKVELTRQELAGLEVDYEKEKEG